MKFYRALIALFFIFIILNNDVVVSAHALKKVHSSALESSKSDEKSERSQRVLNRLANRKAMKPSLKDTNSKNVAKTKTRILPVLIVVIVLVAVIVVMGVTKKIIDKVAEKELKEISSEINKHKLNQLNSRKEENSMLIEFCLGFQQLRKLFKAYSSMGLFSKSEVVSSLNELLSLTGNDLPSKAKQKKYKEFITNAQSRLTSWMNQYNRLNQMVEKSFTKFCYDAYQLRSSMEDANILGDYYTGFTAEDMSNLKAAADIAKDTIVDQSFGSEVTSDMLELKDKSTDRGEGFSILGDNSETPAWLRGYAGAATVVGSLLEIKNNYQELKTKIEENSSGDSSQEPTTLKNVLDYIATGLSLVDNVINLVAGGLTFGGIEFKFPFFSVAAEAVKAVKALVDYLDARKKFKADTSNPKNPGLKIQESLKFWDCLDQVFSFLKEVADLVMTLIAGVTAGVSKIISYSINAFVSTVQMAFSAVKLAKIRNMKDSLITYIRESSARETTESNNIKKRLQNEKCSVYLSLLKMMIEKEMAEMEDLIHNKRKTFAEISATPNIDINARILESKVKMVREICQNDQDYCPEFLEHMELDKTFINDPSHNLANLVSAISYEKAAGEPNSLISVFKGKFASDSYTSDDQAYASKISQELIKSDYQLVFDSPRYAVFVCRLCAKDEISVQAIDNFKQNSEITSDSNFVHFQDTLQFANIEGTELAEFIVAKLKAKPSFSLTSPKYSEITFAGGVTETTRSWIFFKRESLVREDFRVPIDITKTKANYLRDFDELALISVHQEIANSVINFLKGEAKINILSSKVIMKKKKDYPSHIFFLISSKGINLATQLGDVCGSLKSTYKCAITSLKSEIQTLSRGDFANFDHQYHIFSEHYVDDALDPKYISGITLASFTSNGWSVLKNEIRCQLIKQNTEYSKITVLYKPVMRYRNFLANPTSRPDTKIIEGFGRQEAAVRLEIFKTLKETACSSSCKSHFALPSSRRSPAINMKNYIKTSLNPNKDDKDLCSINEADWGNILKTKTFAPFKSQCKAPANTAKENQIASYWDSIVDGFITPATKGAALLTTIKGEACPKKN